MSKCSLYVTVKDPLNKTEKNVYYYKEILLFYFAGCLRMCGGHAIRPFLPSLPITTQLIIKTTKANPKTREMFSTTIKMIIPISKLFPQLFNLIIFKLLNNQPFSQIILKQIINSNFTYSFWKWEIIDILSLGNTC